MALTPEQRRQWQAHRDAIRNCGTCGRPLSAHQGRPDQAELLTTWEALGACINFAASTAALAQIRRQQRAPASAPRCDKCAGRGHTAPNCPW